MSGAASPIPRNSWETGLSSAAQEGTAPRLKAVANEPLSPVARRARASAGLGAELESEQENE
jgi:hypothetical protein